ncbi:hypothetical protein DC20_14860 [Rufibacter tibetensis]|uniref:Uncharacterized protein n=1 Tax=Rufibacter tibetensis TaxID=512763 RepID=A0A0P0C552_9BACT|nr:hypothetical protein DC20_14860 [Rufibacter tibetensis]
MLLGKQAKENLNSFCAFIFFVILKGTCGKTVVALSQSLLVRPQDLSKMTKLERIVERNDFAPVFGKGL